MCLDRLGKLEIPNGIAGAAGPAGANGAGWASGGGDPVGAPAADVLFWLNTASGELFKWNTSTLVWDPIVNSIFGTDGAQWLSGAGVPTIPSTDGYFYLDTSSGDIYQYSSGSWGLPLLNIEGTPGTNGVNGTGLLDTSVNVSAQTFTTSSSFNLGNTVTFNGQQAFPTVGSVVKSTLFVKARYSTGTTANAPTNAEIYYTPRLVNDTSTAFADLNTPTIDQNDTTLDFKILYGPSAINNNYTHGFGADTSSFGVSNSGLPFNGTSPGQLAFPYAYTKIVTTLIRINSTNVVGSVEYTTTTRYGTYTAVYQPTLSGLTLGFGSGDGISIELLGSVTVPSPSYPIQITPIYHIAEKSIL
jgi:hypothetical protein